MSKRPITALMAALALLAVAPAASFAQSPTPTATAAQDDGTAADPPADASKEVKAVYTDYSRDGVIDVCDHTRDVLQQTLDGIEADFDRDFPDFREAVKAGIQRHDKGRCEEATATPTATATATASPEATATASPDYGALPPATDDGSGTPDDGTLPPATDDGSTPARGRRAPARDRRREPVAGADPDRRAHRRSRHAHAVTDAGRRHALQHGRAAGAGHPGRARAVRRPDPHDGGAPGRSPAPATPSARRPTAPRACGRTSPIGSRSAVEHHAAGVLHQLAQRDLIEFGHERLDGAALDFFQLGLDPLPDGALGRGRVDPDTPSSPWTARQISPSVVSQPAWSSCQPPLGPGRERTSPARRSGASTRRTCSGLVPALAERKSELTSSPCWLPSRVSMFTASENWVLVGAGIVLLVTETDTVLFVTTMLTNWRSP